MIFKNFFLMPLGIFGTKLKFKAENLMVRPPPPGPAVRRCFGLFCGTHTHTHKVTSINNTGRVDNH